MKVLLQGLFVALLFAATPAIADPQSSIPGARPHNGIETLSRLNVKQIIAPLTGDGCIVCVQDSGLTALQIYKPLYAPGGVQYDGIRSVLSVPGGKAFNMDAIAAYVQNSNQFINGFGAASGFFAMSNAIVDNAKVWGGAFVVSDSAGVTTGVGAGRAIIGQEYDMNAMNTSTLVQGISILGSSRVQPVGATAITIGQLDSQQGVPGAVAGWTNGINCGDGAIRGGTGYACLQIGAATAQTVSTSNIGGQNVFYNYIDASNVVQHYTSTISTTGAFTWSDSGTGHQMFWGMSALFGNLLGSNYNAGATFPPSGTTTYYLTDNFSNGSREIDLWNADTLATDTFRVYQKTGASAATLVMDVDPKGSLIGNGAHISTAGFSLTTSTTLTSITGLSQSLTAAGLYSCHGHVHFTTAPTTSNGVKVALATSDTLTVTTLDFVVIGYNSAAFATSGTGRSTALGTTAIASTNAFTDLILEAQINVLAAGTLQVQMAENASSGTIASTAGNAGFICQRAA